MASSSHYFSMAPKLAYVRKAKNEKLEWECTVGSRRNRAYGCGSHNGKPIFGHGTNERRDTVAARIGRLTKVKKKEKAARFAKIYLTRTEKPLQ